MNHFLRLCRRRDTNPGFGLHGAGVIASVLLLGGLLAQAAFAQELERAAVTAGGGIASGGRFEAVTAIGQPAVAQTAADGFVLHAGFLFPRPGAAGSLIFRDEFEALPAPSRAAKPVDLSVFSTENPDDR